MLRDTIDSNDGHYDENDNDEDTISIASTGTTRTTNSSISSRSGKRRKRGTKKPPAPYKFDSSFTESHALAIYCASFNNYLRRGQLPILATVGSNRCHVYECPEAGGLRLLLCYADPDANEAFYTCAWTYNTKTLDPLLVIAGQHGIIRVVDTKKHKSICSLIGHGGAINQLKVHPIHACLLLSCSKDYGIRLWNIETHVLIAIFGGVEGHRAEVLSIDFDLRGERFISSGMDHALKLWNLNTTEMQTSIEQSMGYKSRRETSSFRTIIQHFPNFSSRDIHGNYVDCVQWFGDFIISKSCQNAVVIWRMGSASPSTAVKSAPNKRGSNGSKSDIIAEFKSKYCELWFVRFDFNIWRHILAVGNQYGVIYVWELAENSPSPTLSYTLSSKRCKTNVRDVAFSKDACILISVCDDGTIWRWNRVPGL